MKTFQLLDVFDDFYLTQGYGVNQQTYSKYNLLWHEGIDLGNSNKKVIVRSPIDGIIVQDWDTPKGNYGINVVIWDDSQQCAVWICHLDTNLVDYGQRVKAGDPIGEMGGTGNVTGEHLHLNFVKTNSSGQRMHNNKQNNWGFLDPQYPKDPNPPKYPGSMEHYSIEWRLENSDQENSHPKTYSQEEWDKLKHENQDNWDKWQEALKDVEKYKSEAQTRKKDYEDLITELAQLLTLPTNSDKADIKGSVERLLEAEEQLRIAQKRLGDQQKQYEDESTKLRSEIQVLRDEIEKQQKQNETLLQRIDQLESRIDNQQKTSETMNRLQKFFEDILSKLGGR